MERGDEIRGMRKGVRSKRSEVRGQRSEVRGQRSEVSQRAEPPSVLPPSIPPSNEAALLVLCAVRACGKG